MIIYYQFSANCFIAKIYVIFYQIHSFVIKTNIYIDILTSQTLFYILFLRFNKTHTPTNVFTTIYILCCVCFTVVLIEIFFCLRRATTCVSIYPDRTNARTNIFVSYILATNTNTFLATENFIPIVGIPTCTYTVTIYHYIILIIPATYFLVLLALHLFNYCISCSNF